MSVQLATVAVVRIATQAVIGTEPVRRQIRSAGWVASEAAELHGT